jgi:hypothetical protein
MGHGRNFCVSPKVACAANGARTFEEVAAPRCVTVKRCSRLSLLLACLALAAGGSTPVEETVTLDANQLSALPAKAQTVALTPQLPTRDADIEAAGDRIAEAITSLSKRRGTTTARNTTAALHALDQASAALARALHDKPHDEPVREALRSAIRDLNTAEQNIRRNASADATRDLNTLNKKLDTLHGAEDSKL